MLVRLEDVTTTSDFSAKLKLNESILVICYVGSMLDTYLKAPTAIEVGGVVEVSGACEPEFN